MFASFHRAVRGEVLTDPDYCPAPPSEPAPRPQSHPARRLAHSVGHIEPDPAGQAPVEGPGAVLQASGTNVVDRFAESRVGRGAGQGSGRAEVVKCPQDVVAPAVGMKKSQKLFVGRLTGAEPTEEGALQKIFLDRKSTRLN